MSGLANDVFFSLSRGLKFKQKTNKTARSLFSREKTLEDAATSSSVHKKNQQDSLSFFKVETAKQTSKQSGKIKGTEKKNKRRRRGLESLGLELDGKGETENKTPEEIIAFRRRLKIKAIGNDVPNPIDNFDPKKFATLALEGSHKTQDQNIRNEYLKIANVLKRNIELSQYKEPTPVQMQTLPAMLHGRDVLACAPTGSGKTAAFLIPLIMRLRSSLVNKKKNKKAGSESGDVRGLIIAPTRELAIQILREFEKLSKGKEFHAFVLSKSLTNKKIVADVIITTPLRMIHFLKSKELSLDTVETLILDEADKLFELGFLEQVDEILAACTNKQMQRSLFSATIPQQIEDLAKTILRDPINITIGSSNAAAETINQSLIFVGKEEGKLMAIRQIVQEGLLKPPCLIFVQSKERAKELYQELIYDGIKVDAIHSERTQTQRDQIIKRFRTGNIWVLICTDLMGRGVDFKGVNCVVNYDLPQSAISYIHRIGRTGRAGRKGEAITLYTLDDVEYLRSIANVMKLSGSKLEKWMSDLKKPSTRKKKKLIKNPKKRKRIATTSNFDLKRAAKKKNVIRQSLKNTEKKL